MPVFSELKWRFAIFILCRNTESIESFEIERNYNEISVDPRRGSKFEPRHDKTNKMSVRPAKLRSAWASAQSDQSFRCALNG